MLALTDWLKPWKWTWSEWDDIREWRTAIGTVGAVAVALGIASYSEWKRRRRTPALTLTFDEIFGVRDEAVSYSTGGLGNGWYVRLQIANELGKIAAQDVEVLIETVTKIPANPQHQWRPVIDISTPAITWTHTNSTRQTLGAGVARMVDLGVAYATAPVCSRASSG